MTTLFFRNRQLLVLTVLILIAGGLSALATLPRQEDPRLTGRFAAITTAFPGASATRVEALVTEKIEEQLQEVDAIKEIRSVSRADLSFVVIELGDRVTDADSVWSEVRSELEEVTSELPAGTGAPRLDDQRFVTAFTQLDALRWDLDSAIDRPILGRLAEALADDLRRVPGTELVRLYGKPTEEITVDVDPSELAQLGITVEELGERLRRADTKVAAGTLRSEERSTQIELVGEFESVERIRAIPLVDSPDGAVVRLGDIASVRKGVRAPDAEVAIVDGERTVLIASRMAGQTRIDRWAGAMAQAKSVFAEQLPSGVRLVSVFDQNIYTDQRLHSLMSDLLLGVTLVVLVLLVTMGWKSALIVGSALPLSCGAVLFGLSLLEVPLHQMSITGLIVALGLLIDNAIVMTDDVRTRTRAGVAPPLAIAESVRLLFVPLLGSTLTTIIAFMPILLIDGPTGEFVGPIAISVVLALIASFTLAMTVVPTIAALVSHASRGADGTVPRTGWWQHGWRSDTLDALYRRSVLLATRRPWVGAMIAVALPVAGLLVIGSHRQQFFPMAERDQFQVELRLPVGTAIERTEAIGLEVDRILRSEPGVTRVAWLIGGSLPSVYYNLLMREDGNAQYAQAIVRLEEKSAVHTLVPKLQRELDAEFPEAQVLVRELGQGPPINAPVEVRIYGPNLDELRSIGESVRAKLAELPEVLHTRATLGGGIPKLWIDADEVETRWSGLALGHIAEQLATQLQGATGGSVLEDAEELPVMVRVREAERRSLPHVASALLRPATSGGAPHESAWTSLSALGTVELKPALGGIPRIDGERYTAVEGFLVAGALPIETVSRFRRTLDELALPHGYRIELGGDEEEQGEATAALATYLPVLFLLMLATTVLSFRSFRLAAVIGAVAALSFGLGSFAIGLSGYPYGFMAILGTAGLIGVAINDSIVVLAAIREHPLARSGDATGIVEAVHRTSRHVFSTTLTTIAGFTPLILSGGSFWPPLAVVMAGGVAGATLIALYGIPAAYSVLYARASSSSQRA